MKPEEERFFDSFREVVKAVNSTLDRQEVLDLLVNNVTQVMDLKASAIRLLDARKRTLELVVSHGLSEKYLNKGPVGRRPMCRTASCRTRRSPTALSSSPRRG